MIKVLHTSDWHLGRTLLGYPMLEHQGAFLDWLFDLAVQEKVDLVVVSGDIHDRSSPNQDAIQLLDQTLPRFSDAGIALLVTSGNHDSRVRLGQNRYFLKRAGIHLRTDRSDVSEAVIFEKEDCVLAAFGIPYLDPMVDAGKEERQWDVEASHTALLEEAGNRIRTELARIRNGEERPVYSLVASHAFVMKGSKSDSERALVVGGLGEADPRVFREIDYVAMGHLHGPQEISVTAETHIRYSGSPLPFSFSEADHVKQVIMLEFEKDGLQRDSIRSIKVPQPRGMKRITGSFQELLDGAEGAEYRNDWLEINYTDPELIANAMEVLRRKFPYILNVQRAVQDISNQGNDIYVNADNVPLPELLRDFTAFATGNEAEENLAAAIDACCEAWTSLANTQAITS